MELSAATRIAREIQLLHGASGAQFHGRSMEPLLRDGDELAVEPVRWADIRVGDILTYRLDDRYPTLRVVRRFPGRLVLRGDNWPFADFDVWPEDILGRVVGRGRNGAFRRAQDLAWKLATARALVDDRARRTKRRAEALLHRVTGGVRRRVARTMHGSERPTSLQINIAATCNLACRMCPYLAVHDDERYEREMSVETFRAMLPTLATLDSILLTGSGEPMFNRNLVRFIELAREAHPAIRVDVTTNGTLLTESMARELIRVGLTRLAVSIDGATQETVGAIRTGINLSKVLTNLETLRRLKEEAGSRFPIVRVNYMIGYRNYRELPDMIRMAGRLGISEINALEIFTGSEDGARDNLFHSLEEDGGATLKLAHRLAQASRVALLLPITAHSGCHHPYTPHITESGDVSPCCYLSYEGRTFNIDGQEERLPRVVYGNVTDDSLDTIWRSKTFSAFRRRTARGQFDDACKTCMTSRVATSKRVQETLAWTVRR